MSNLIRSFNTQDTMFHLEIPSQNEKISPRKDQIKPLRISGLLCEKEKMIKKKEKVEKGFHQIKSDPLELLIKEIKEINGWGNSFDQDLEASFKRTHEYCTANSSEKSILPRLTITQNKENAYSPDIFDGTEGIFSESPKALYNPFPIGSANTI